MTIESWSEAVPWAVPFVTEARRLGARPIMLYEDEPAFFEALESGSGRATGRVGDHEWRALAESDAYVFFFGPGNWPRLEEMPDRQTAGVAAYNADWYRRAAKAKVRGARMYLGRTSEAAARFFGVNLGTWRSQLQRATLESPEKMHRLGDRVGRRLRTGKEARLTHSNGTDLTFRLGGYPVQVDDALVDSGDLRAGNNMATIPGGVVGVATDHRSAEGTAVGNHDVYPGSGPASGVRWTFRDGQLDQDLVPDRRARVRQGVPGRSRRGAGVDGVLLDRAQPGHRRLSPDGGPGARGGDAAHWRQQLRRWEEQLPVRFVDGRHRGRPIDRRPPGPPEGEDTVGRSRPAGAWSSFLRPRRATGSQGGCAISRTQEAGSTERRDLYRVGQARSRFVMVAKSAPPSTAPHQPQ